MEANRKLQLETIAINVRTVGLEMVENARSGHIGGAFSLSEIMSVLYFDKMRINPEKPGWEDRDRFVLSKGHATVALYPTLALKGFFSSDLLKTFRKTEGALSGHAEMTHVPGVDMSTGSLGQGLSAAVGMALAGKQTGKDYYVYAVIGDGEMQEGQIWEAMMFAASSHLDHLIVVLDSNKVQLDGTVTQIMNMGDIEAKCNAFGFHTQSIDGHDVEQIAAAVDTAKATPGKPHMIIANTVKGKGISFMEGKNEWHGKTPNDEQFAQAFRELARGVEEMSTNG